jgi:hypothetical protein
MTQPLAVQGALSELHAARAAGGVGPGVNSPFTNPAFDTSGNGNSGALVNFAETVSSGWAGSATLADPDCLVFDGTGLVELPNLGASRNKPFTYEVWMVLPVDAPNSGNHCLIAESRAAWGPPLTTLMISGWVPMFQQWGDGWAGGPMAMLGAPVNDGLWHHLVATSDGSNFRLYVDNSAPVVSGGAPVDTTNCDLTELGNYASSTSGGFRGKLAVARIYPFCLSAAQIAQNFAAGYLWLSPDPNPGGPVDYPTGPVIKIGKFDIPVLP